VRGQQSFSIFVVRGPGAGVTVSVMVFTRDLRLGDNPALAAAARAVAVVPLFVLDEAILARTAGHANRLGFLLDSLHDLDTSLRALGGSLVVRAGPWVKTVLETAQTAGADRIHVAEDVSGYATVRLMRLEKAAAGARIAVVRHPGITAVEPAAVRTTGGGPYQVFAPYYQRWLAASWRPVVAVPSRITLPDGIGSGRLPRLAELSAVPRVAATARGGESEGLARLSRWASDKLVGYHRGRDDLGADVTSRLSAYLHFGCLSPLALAAEMSARPGGAALARQIAWRDFFHQVLAARPDAAWRDYRDRGDRWRDDPEGLAAWQQGRTGYPVVDAAMHQLAQEGFMHNRARMIAASFLTNDLQLDWRAGAAHFMRHLTDADLACNQLNWQWAAGTGTDTNPHRIFNPTRQGRRFDPTGAYVRRHVPELAGLPAAAVIHDPDPATRRARGYPAPIIDHRQAIGAYRARRR
jgi:deoxyribodipyrimidine photo-lyase